VWTTRPPELPSWLPDAALWQEQGGVWIRGRAAWQIVAGPAHRVEPEDVPEAVRALLPGISHMVELNLEPTAAPQAARTLLTRAAKALAAMGHGVVLDLQASTATTPAGVPRYVAPSAGASLTALELSWFSVDAAVASREGVEAVLDCLDRYVPEALPVRYGLYEPPSFRYRETGRQHLVEFLAEEYLKPGRFGFAVWYPKRPVLGVGLSIGVGNSPAGWRCHRLTVTLEASVLEQDGWPSALHQLWRRMARTLRAFYADVRLLHRYRTEAGTIDEWLDAERHPVCGPFWAGIPTDGARAVALGQPYLSLWPEFAAVAEHEGEIGFIAAPNWMHPENVLVRVDRVPARLAQQSPGYEGLGPNRNPTYPSDWPFSA
jgi:hypothetical protein